MPVAHHPTEPLPVDARCVLVCANLRAGSGRTEQASGLAVALRERGLRPTLVTELDELSQRALEAHAAGDLRAVVAAGGDGTVSEVVNRIPAETPVAVLPLGTANLLAKYAGIRSDVADLAAALADGRCWRLDAGLANGRVFLLMAGVGFDAEVVHRMHELRQGPISYWSYAKPIWRAIRSYDYPTLRIYCDGQLAGPLEAAWAFVVNVPAYAGGLNMAPEADPADGGLEVATFRRGSLCRGLWYVTNMYARRLARLGDYQVRTARRIRIEADLPVRYQLDGDPGGQLPLEIAVLPGRLRLVVADKAESRPRNAAASQSQRTSEATS